MSVSEPIDRRDIDPRPGQWPNVSDQRRHPRYLTLRTGKIIAGSEEIDCAVLDVSAGGARILAPKDAEIPSAFVLLIDPEKLRFDCRLAWSDGQMVGVAFNQKTLPRSAIWLLEEGLEGACSQLLTGAAVAREESVLWRDEPAGGDDMQENRRFTRMRPTGLMSKTGTIIVDPNKPTIPCNIIDMSAGGICLDAHGEAPVPQRFVLHYGGTKKTCRVVWMKGRRIGAAF